MARLTAPKQPSSSANTRVLHRDPTRRPGLAPGVARSSKDAVSPQACGSGTTTNPVSCHMDKCGDGNTACCRPLKPTCAWNLAEPAITGEYYEGVSSGATCCTPPSSCGDPLEFSLTYEGNPDECGPGGDI